MDIAAIVVKVAGDAVPLPGLRASGEQNERLNHLVRTTGRRLVAFHDQLRGKWENIPDNFKTILDDYQNALEDVLALARSYTPRKGLKAHVVSWMRQRDRSITRLQRRLEEAEKEAMMYFSLDTSLTVAQLVAVDDTRMDDIIRQLRGILDSFSSVTGRGRNDISERVRPFCLKDHVRGFIVMRQYLVDRRDLQLLRTISVANHNDYDYERGGAANYRGLEQAQSTISHHPEHLYCPTIITNKPNSIIYGD
ncbi:hypothetical protein BU17DRAFT_79054 [Hysterangium stoloniferum]|nr:hypothetical protein BU17DRAFT_79054 [Hysterangium stoloniferum]